MKQISKTVNDVRQTAFQVHVFFKNGFLEKVYENALANRLRKQGFLVEQQARINVMDEDGTSVGDYVCDLLVENCLLIELKACHDLDDIHTAQLFAYLKATGIHHGMLMHFGAPKFQLKKYIL